MRGYASGYNLKIPILSARDMRPVQRSAPSSAWLMPTPRDWSSEPIIITSTKNYTANDYETFFEDIDFSLGFDVWKNVSNVTQSLAFPDVTLHYIYGANVSTVTQVVYAAGEFPNGDPTSLYCNGDGTVNEESLVLCNNWKGDQVQNLKKCERLRLHRPSVGRRANIRRFLSLERSSSACFDVLRCAFDFCLALTKRRNGFARENCAIPSLDREFRRRREHFCRRQTFRRRL